MLKQMYMYTCTKTIKINKNQPSTNIDKKRLSFFLALQLPHCVFYSHFLSPL